VLGCGASPPPDKRRFSSVDSIRDTIVRGILDVRYDGPVIIFLEGAKSYARDRIARNERNERNERESLRSLDARRDRCVFRSDFTRLRKFPRKSSFDRRFASSETLLSRRVTLLRPEL
jgi:hypothetical protein